MVNLRIQDLQNDIRVNFYIGELLYNININDDLVRPRKFIWDCIRQNKPIRKSSIYEFSLLKKLRKYNLTNNKLMYHFGDIQDVVYNNFYSLMKNRPRETPNDGVLLRCLDFRRHWGNYYNRPDDIDFEQKRNAVIWRGVTTGSENNPGNRFDLVKKWFKKNPSINVGFSAIVQNKEKYKKYVLNNVDISNLLKYKYILSVEGNDKDSGLQWKLNSNSVVFMTKPRITTWLMETTLVPNYHYVLLKDDYSDLEEKLDWCNQNQDKCLNINQNARRFMEQFKDSENEEKIEEKVLKKYFKLLNESVKASL